MVVNMSAVVQGLQQRHFQEGVPGEYNKPVVVDYSEGEYHHPKSAVEFAKS